MIDVTARGMASETQSKVDYVVSIKVYLAIFGAKGDGVTNDTQKILDAMAYAVANGIATIKFPGKTYLITPGAITIPDGMIWEGSWGTKIITKEIAPYHRMIKIAEGARGIRISRITFDQWGDGDFLPTNDGNKGCHMLWAPNCYDIEFDHCTFYLYGITAIITNPFDGYGDEVTMKYCRGYFKRNVNTVYDVSVFNLDAMKVLYHRNEVIAVKREGISNWMPETAVEIHSPKCRITDNDSTRCKNGVLHVQWPTLYAKYDTEHRGKVVISKNNAYKGLIGVSLWGAHKQPGVITRNVEISKNYTQSHLGGGGFKPGSAIELRDGLDYDASYFRDIKVLDNIVEFTYTKYVSLANQITFGTNFIATTGDDFKDLMAGDYVLIAGCTVNAGNNKSGIYITAVEPKKLYFAAGSFTAGAETAAITVRINYADVMASSLDPLYCGAILGVTNNSIEDMEISGNTVKGWPWAAVDLRALQVRGTNQHKRIDIYKNRFIDCAWSAPSGTGVIWQGDICLEDCADVDIQWNDFIKGGVLNKTPLKLISMGDHGMGTVKFLNNKVSSLTAREAEYESLPIFQTLITDVAEFLSLGCKSDIKDSEPGTPLPASTGTIAVTMDGSIKTLTPTGACTLNASAGKQGQECTFVITTSGTTSFNITFNTNFKANGVLATGTTTAKTFIFKYIYVGTTWIEISRTVAL